MQQQHMQLQQQTPPGPFSSSPPQSPSGDPSNQRLSSTFSPHLMTPPGGYGLMQEQPGPGPYLGRPQHFDGNPGYSSPPQNTSQYTPPGGHSGQQSPTGYLGQRQMGQGFPGCSKWPQDTQGSSKWGGDIQPKRSNQ